MPQGYTLELDEPWTFLNARGIPVEGHRLTVITEDDVTLTIDLTPQEYANPEKAKAKVEKRVAESKAIREALG